MLDKHTIFLVQQHSMFPYFHEIKFTLPSMIPICCPLPNYSMCLVDYPHGSSLRFS